MSGMCTVCEQPGCFSARHEEEMRRSPHRLPDGLTAHLRRFKQHDHDDQMAHLRHAHDWDLASNEPRHEVHRLLHEDGRFAQAAQEQQAFNAQRDAIVHNLAHPSAEPHPHLRNPDPIVLTMRPDPVTETMRDIAEHPVTVVMQMSSAHAEALRRHIEDAEANAKNGYLPSGSWVSVDDGKHELRLPVTVHRIGSLPERDEPPLPKSATSATMPRGGTFTSPIYQRDTRRWMEWHPMAQTYVEVEPPACIGDTDGDGDCALNLCPRCGPKRGTL